MARQFTLNKLAALLIVPVLAVALFGVGTAKVHAATGACTAPSTDYGTVTGLSVVTTGATAKIWSRIAIPDTTNNNYLLEVDNSSGTALDCFTFTGNSGAVYTSTDASNNKYFNNDGSNWFSVTVPTVPATGSMPAATYKLKLIGNAPNVVVDRVLFSQSGDTCVPIGNGDNCTNPPDTTPPVVSMSSPSTNGATISSTPTLTATATDADSLVKQVDFYVVNSGGTATKVGTDLTGSANSYSYTLTTAQKLSPGTYSVYAVATDTAATPNTAQSTSVTGLTVADTTPPVISSPAVGSITQTSATVTWTTDEAADSQVKYGTTASYGSQTTLVSTKVTSHSVNISGLTANTTYHYQIISKDAAGNQATPPADATFTTQAPAPDTTPPTVSMSAPAGGATLSGASVTVSASASDSGSGVAGVQFTVTSGGVTTNLGTEDTSGPTYSTTWDTTKVTNGSYTLSAVARDAAGNRATATTITVTVSNTVVTYKSGDINQDGKVNGQDFSIFIAKFGQTGSGLGRSDINTDGKVNGQDFSIFIAQFGT